MSRVALIGNFVLFQAVWFTLVLDAASGVIWHGVLLALLAIGWHLFQSKRALPELLLVVIAALIGAAFESLLVLSGWVVFKPEALIAGLVPLWMVALWATFATCLNVSLRWLRPHMLWAALLGAAGGPAAYYSGVRLGALSFSNKIPALIMISAGWALVTPLLLRVARRFDGFELKS